MTDAFGGLDIQGIIVMSFEVTSSALTGTFPSRGRQGLGYRVTKSLPLEGKVPLRGG